MRWNEGINVAVKELQIKKSKSSQESSFEDLQNSLEHFFHILPLFHSLSVENLEYEDVHAKIYYQKDTPGFIDLNAPKQKLYANFTIDEPYIVLNIKEYTNRQEKLYLTGSLIADTKSLKLYTKLSLKVREYAELQLFSVANKKELHYRVKSLAPITHINELLSMAHLPKELDFWANRAIDAKSAKINKLYGLVEFTKLEDAYKNLYADLTLQKLNYTYNSELDAIHTKTTDLIFKDGVLFIYPREAYSYGMFLDKSWIKVNLTPQKEFLDIYLDFDAQLNKDVLHILQAYKIKVPFLQKNGVTKTDLHLSVDLRTIDVEAHGEFRTKKALFEYLGLDIVVRDAFIKLDNYDVNIPQMKAYFKDIASADLTAHYNAKVSQGKIDFKIHKLQAQKDIKLNTSKKPLALSYTIDPKGDYIYIANSYWNIKGFNLFIEKNKIAFDMKKLQLNIPPVTCSVDKVANGYISGIFDIKRMKLKAILDLLHFKYQGIEAAQTDTLFDLVYDKEFSVSSKDDILFTINGSAYKIAKLQTLFKEDEIAIKHTMLHIGEFIETKIYAKYKYDTQKAYVTLNKFTFKNPQTGEILYKNSKIPLIASFEKDRIYIHSQELQASLISTDKYWKLDIDTLNILAKKSAFLQKYKINNGKLSFQKESDESILKFKGLIHYKYALLTTRKKAINDYNISGYISKSQKVYIDINDKVHAKIAKDIQISLHNTGINLQQAIAFVQNLQEQSSDNTEPSPTVILQAKDSFIKLDKERVVLADTLNLQYYDDILTAQLRHKDGEAGFKLQQELFHLYGNNFNDQFMQNLFLISKFKGGSLDFSVNGTLDNYSGIFFVKDTTMLDYVILNNVLAFINTVPSLATFSLPGYDKNGLYVDNAYMRFEANDGLFNISDLYIGSKEIKILGKGNIDLNKDTIDLTMNLKTDLGSNISKIPLVGYILLDGDTISTSLKVHGPLKDPKVETMLAKDIVVAPLNIILRTLTLPYKLIQDGFDTEKKE